MTLRILKPLQCDVNDALSGQIGPEVYLISWTKITQAGSFWNAQ